MVRGGVALALVLSWCALAGADQGRAREHYKRGMAEFMLDKWDAAIAEFEAGFREEPQPAFLYNLARAHAKCGRLEQAIIYYRKYLESDPDTADRGLIEAEITRFEGSLRPTPITDARAHALFQAGEKALAEARYEAAVASFKQAHDLSHYSTILYYVGLSYDQLGRIADAVAYYEQYLRADPTSGRRAGLAGRIAALKARQQAEPKAQALAIAAPKPAVGEPQPVAPRPSSPRRRAAVAVGVSFAVAAVLGAVTAGLVVGLSGVEAPSPSTLGTHRVTP